MTRTLHAAAASGGGRSSAIRPQDVGEEIPRDGDFSHLKRKIRPWLATFAPILMSLSLRLVSYQSLIGSGDLLER